MAAKGTIGGRIVLEGEAEYRAALTNITKQQKELRSEMKLCVSEFKDSQNSLEALTSKHQILERQVALQTQKVELYTSALDKAKNTEEEAKNKVTALASELEKAEAELVSMKNSTEASADAIEAQQQSIDELKNKLGLAEQAYTKAGQKTTDFKTTVNNAQAELNNMQHELQETSKYMEEAENSTDACATSIDEYGKRTKESTDTSKNFGKESSQAVNQMAEALAAAGIAASVKEIADALMDCIDAAAFFETAMAKLSTIADTSAISMDQLKAEILSVSSEVGVASADIADVAYNAISAGVDSANAVSVATDAAKLASAGFTDTASALSVLTTSMNAYGISAEDLTRISDSLIQTQNLGVLTIDQLASKMGKAISTASAYSIDIYNLEAGYISLTKAGISVDESTTYLSSMFSELGKASSDVAKIIKEKTGKTFGELMKSGYSLADVMEILSDSVSGNSEALMNLWSSQEAGKASNAIINQGLSEFNKNLESVRNSTGSTERAFETMADTTEVAQNKMNVAMENLKITIGEELQPAMDELYSTGEDAFSWMSEFISEHPEVVQGLVVITAGVGGLVVAITAAKVAMVAFNAVAAMNPIGLAIGAVAGLTTALVALSATTDSYSATLKEEIAASQEIINSLNDDIEARKSANTEMTASIATIDSLASSIALLNTKEVLSTQEKAKMSSMVAQLNSVMPELNLCIDEQTGLLTQNNDELEALISNQKEVLLMEAAQEDLTAIVEEQYEALKQKTEIEAEMLELEAEITEQTKIANMGFVEYAEYVENAGGVVQEFQQTLEENQRAYEDYEEQLTEVNGILTTLDEEYATATEMMSSFATTAEEVSTVMVGYGVHMYEVSTETAASIETLRAAYEEAKASALDSINSQVELFAELSYQSDLSVEQMISNLQSQTETYTQYSEDLRLASQLMEEDTTGSFSQIVQSIMDMGIEGAGYLHELVTAAGDSTDSFNEVMVSFAEMNDAKNTLSTTMGDIDTSYSKTMDDLVSNTSNTTTSIADAVKSGCPGIATSTSDLCDTMINTTDLLLGLNGNTSTVFQQRGASVSQGVADGISGNSGAIQNALQSSIDNAVNNASFSGISAKINRILGDALS